MGIYTRQSLSPGTCAQEPGNKARGSGSQQDAHEFLLLTFLIGEGAEPETETLEFICLNHCYQAFSRGIPT